MITIADVLGAAEIEAVLESLVDAPFVDGRSTAGSGAQDVKSNLQGHPDAQAIKGVTEKVRRALEDNSVFQVPHCQCDLLALWFRALIPA